MATTVSPAAPAAPAPADAAGLVVLGVLLLDTVLLALLELFFLPLRLDGVLLPELGAFPVPVTVILAMVTTPMLVTRTAALVHPRLAVAPLALWVVVVLGVGLFGPGGDIVLIQDWRALVLLAGGALPAAFALGGTFPTARHIRAAVQENKAAQQGRTAKQTRQTEQAQTAKRPAPNRKSEDKRG